MKRRLFNIAAAISLLLCVATLALRVRGIWGGDFVNYHRWHGRTAEMYGAGWGSGGLLFFYTRSEQARELQDLHKVIWYHNPAPFDAGGHLPVKSLPNRLGFTVVVGEAYDYGLRVPLWFVAMLASVPVLLWAAAYHRTRRGKIGGRCPDCGYDLRATPNRCPECGRAAPEQAAA